MKQKEAAWNARLAESDARATQNAKRAAKNVKGNVSAAKKEAEMISKYLKERGAQIAEKNKAPVGKHPKQVRVATASKVDAVGAEGQVKDEEALRDELRALKKKIGELRKENADLQDTFNRYEQQKLVLESEVNIGHRIEIDRKGEQRSRVASLLRQQTARHEFLGRHPQAETHARSWPIRPLENVQQYGELGTDCGHII